MQTGPWFLSHLFSLAAFLSPANQVSSRCALLSHSVFSFLLWFSLCWFGVVASHVSHVLSLFVFIIWGLCSFGIEIGCWWKKKGFENEFLPFLWGEIHTACFPALESSTFPAVPPGKQNILSNNVHVYCMARTISEDTQWHFVFNEGYSKCTLESEIANYSPGMHVTPISFQPV